MNFHNFGKSCENWLVKVQLCPQHLSERCAMWMMYEMMGDVWGGEKWEMLKMWDARNVKYVRDVRGVCARCRICERYKSCKNDHPSTLLQIEQNPEMLLQLKTSSRSHLKWIEKFHEFVQNSEDFSSFCAKYMEV